MFLYELAIELGKHSTELVEAAAALGLTDVGPATELSREQAAALRSQVNGVPPLPPPPSRRSSAAGGPPAPLPAVPTGPLVAEPVVDRGAGPSGAPVPKAPAHWGPPKPLEPPPRDPADLSVPTFEAPAFAPVPAPSLTSEGLGDVVLPPAPPTSWGAPAKGSAGGPPEAGAGDGLSKGQIGALVAVGLVVLALFAFMAVNTGPDGNREQAIAAEDAEVDRTTAPVPTTVPAATSTTEAGAPDAYAPADLEAFCRGGLSISKLEARLQAAVIDEDWAELSSLVATRRQDWEGDVGALATGAPPVKVDEILRYKAAEQAFFDAVSSSSSFEELITKVDRLEMMRASSRVRQIAELVAYHCT